MKKGTKIKKLDRGEIAEIKDLFSGEWASMRELARIFDISIDRMRWIVNFKNYRTKQRISNINYRKRKRSLK